VSYFELLDKPFCYSVHLCVYVSICLQWLSFRQSLILLHLNPYSNLQSIPILSQAHEGKALCVDWMTGDSEGEQGLRVVSGGSDCLLRSTPVVTSAPSGEKDSA
jgi:hypothetical protein